MQKLRSMVIAGLMCATITAEIGAQTPGRYKEPNRPQFHFSPEKMWMNDPNGMVYYEGEYHLFYQYYPDDVVWGPMHWGHAVSKDLVKWTHLPIALYPDELGYIFSGSAVVDWKNTSGFGKNGKPALVAMFTHHDMVAEKAGKIEHQVQSLAYSNDRGRTWTKYAGNPVIANPGVRDFRDTKVFWHEATRHWVMVLAVGDHVAFYNSPDLKNWKPTGTFGADQGSHGGVWECPDLFELPVEGDKSRWVLLLSINPGGVQGGSATQYFVGDFDGRTFTNANPASETLWLDYGADNYAGVTWSDAPEGERLFIGWMSNWQYATKVPTSPWRSAMTVARELTLHTTPQGVRLASYPVPGQKKLRGKMKVIKSQSLDNQIVLSKNLPLHDLEISFDLAQTTAKEFGVRLANSQGEAVLVGYEPATRRFFIDRTKSGKMDFSAEFAGRHYAPRMSNSPILNWRQLTDLSSVELFVDGGVTNMTDLFFPTAPLSEVSLFAKGGKVVLREGGKIFGVKRIW